MTDEGWMKGYKTPFTFRTTCVYGNFVRIGEG